LSDFFRGLEVEGFGHSSSGNKGSGKDAAFMELGEIMAFCEGFVNLEKAE
jgi:hypothetical protein